jgi:hypothetical protein
MSTNHFFSDDPEPESFSPEAFLTELASILARAILRLPIVGAINESPSNSETENRSQKSLASFE